MIAALSLVNWMQRTHSICAHDDDVYADLQTQGQHHQTHPRYPQFPFRQSRNAHPDQLFLQNRTVDCRRPLPHHLRTDGQTSMLSFRGHRPRFHCLSRLDMLRNLPNLKIIKFKFLIKKAALDLSHVHNTSVITQT